MHDGYHQCSLTIIEDNIFSSMDDNSDGLVSSSEATSYGMSEECFTMYSDLENYVTGAPGFS